MMTDLKSLERIQDYYARHHVMPSFSAIAELLGLKSKSSVSALVSRLKARGFIDQAPGGRLAPTPRFFERSLGGSVRAGLPEPAGDFAPDTFSLSDIVRTPPGETILLPVEDDSLSDAGIFGGDIAIVARRPTANAGQLVAAMVNDKLTLKYLEQDEDGYFLHSGNRRPIVRLPQNQQLFGVIAGLVRRYAA